MKLIITKFIKDPVSALTHFAGLILSCGCTAMLIREAYLHADGWYMASFIVFGVALMLLYLASTLYHWLPVSPKVSLILRRVDHMMIFVLIAGTYTPVCLISLRGVWGWSLFAVIWALAVAGIVLKAFWINAPRWLSSGIYLLMGWIVIIAFFPLVKALSPNTLALLVAGGCAYSLGAVIYAAKWPPFKNPFFGFHEIFHLFVMGGSFFHAMFMFRLLPAF